MLFRKPPRRRPDAFRDESPQMRLFRYVVILLLCGGAVWGLWENGRRRTIAVMEQRGAEIAAPFFSEAESAKLAEYTERFQQEYGLPIVLDVRAEPPHLHILDTLAGIEAPGGAPRRVVLIVCPPARRVFFLAPPAVLQALGEDAQALAGPLFVPYFASGDWRSGLKEALRRMTVRLDAALPKP